MGIWFDAMTSRHGRSRIGRLAPEKAVIFAAACVTHAMDVVKRSPRFLHLTTCEHIDEYAPWEALLLQYWNDLPSQADSAPSNEFAQLVEMTVDREAGTEARERNLTSPGAENLMWATLYAFARPESCSVGTCAAFESAYSSFQAVFNSYATNPTNTDDPRGEELRTSPALEEIDFQFNLLKSVEECMSPIVTYADLMKMTHLQTEA